MEKLFHEVANIFPMMSEDEYQDLKNNIKEVGLREAVWLHPDGSIIDGRNRYKACLELGITPTYRTWNSDGSLVLFVVSLNLHRRHLTPGQRAAVAVEVKPMLAKEKEKIRLANLKQNQSTEVEIFPLREQGKARDQAGEMFNVNGKYVDETEKLKEQEPELFEDVKLGKTNIPDAKRLANLDDDTRERVKEKLENGEAKNVKQAIKKTKKEKKIESIKTSVIPEGQYHVLVVDPPWRYDNRVDDETHRAANPYPDMSLAEIEDFPIPNLSYDDCILWLWTTNAFMEPAHKIAKHWGFEVKTILTWVKHKMGTGDWLRGKTEHCLMCVKGSPVVNLTNQTTVIEGKLREHSRKPDEFYEMVDQLCVGEKVDIFAREQRTGWEVYGNETDNF